MGRTASAAAVAAAFLGALLTGCGGAPRPALTLGAVFPLQGTTASLAGEELRGAQMAVELVNADGGVDGRQVTLDVRDVSDGSGVAAAVAAFRREHVAAVIGAYSSQLSITAAAAVSRAGMVYWETGAVADQLTGEGLPDVFRVGADGSDLGGNSAAFALARLGLAPGQLRVFLVTAGDSYAESVAGGVLAGLRGTAAQVVGSDIYDPYAPQWQPILAGIRAARPNVIMLSAHIPDGVAFRRAFVAAGLHVTGFIGTTMAQCVPDFGRELGAEAYGVYASDRPTGDFNPTVLSPSVRQLFDRFAAAWRDEAGGAPDEEAVAGFSATWTLVHDVLPHATSLGPAAIAAAARSLSLPWGSLPNGAGIEFAAGAGQLGQNVRAAAVVEQWGPSGERTVWPPAFATAAPLPASSW